MNAANEGDGCLHDDELEIAKHEVGHALVAELEGFKVYSIELDPEGGITFHDGVGDLLEAGEHPRTVGMKCAKLAAAGEAASSVRMSATDNEDLRRAIWLGELGHDFFAIRAVAIDRARQRLEPHRDAIDRIANELVQRGVLGREEFLELIKGENQTCF